MPFAPCPMQNKGADMDVKLESLIEKIKKDGIEEARRGTEEIIQKANKKAGLIVEEAKNQAEKILDDSRKEAERLKDNTESSLRQAGRDLALASREQIVNLFDRILKRSISKELSPDFMKQLIIKIIDKWSPRKEEVEVLASEKDKRKLEELLLSQLKQEAKKTIEIKISKSVDKGFRIGLKGEDAYYDFTPESILECFKKMLNPAISAILKEKNG